MYQEDPNSQSPDDATSGTALLGESRVPAIDTSGVALNEVSLSLTQVIWGIQIEIFWNHTHFT